jgi:hypothetical protein
MKVEKGYRIYYTHDKMWRRVKRTRVGELFGRQYVLVNERDHQIEYLSHERFLRELNNGELFVFPRAYVCPLD